MGTLLGRKLFQQLNKTIFNRRGKSQGMRCNPSKGKNEWSIGMKPWFVNVIRFVQKYGLKLRGSEGRTVLFSRRPFNHSVKKVNFLFERFIKHPANTYLETGNWKILTYWTLGKSIRTAFSALLLIVGLVLQFVFQSSTSFYGAKACFIGATVIGGYHMFITSYRNLQAGQPNIRTFLVLPLIGLLLLGRWLEAALFVLLVTINEAIESSTVNQAKKAMQDVYDLLPKEANFVRNGKIERVPVDRVKVGEKIFVNSGEQIPLDGKIIRGSTLLNERLITGIYEPIEKVSGDRVFAGCINEGEPIEILVEKLAKDSKINKIIAFVERAQLNEAPVQQFMRNFMVYYSPVVTLLTLFIAILPPLVTGASWSKWIYISLAIYIAACPCVLLMATPLPFIISIARSAKAGIILKNGTTIEELDRIRGVAFDQIGTLTVGNPIVSDIVTFSNDKDAETELFEKAISVIQNCKHPFSAAIRKEAKKRGIQALSALQRRTIEGKGTYALIDGTMYTVGSIPFLLETHKLDEKTETLLRQLKMEGKSIITVSSTKRFLGFFALQDTLRQEAKDLIANLKEEGIEKFFILTEDNEENAYAIAEELGIEHVFPDLLAEEKTIKVNKLRSLHSYIAFISRKLEEQGEKMVTSESLNITNGARESNTPPHADIVFLKESLANLPWLIHVSKQAMKIVKRNLYFVFSLKLIALLLVIPNFLTVWNALLIDVIAFSYIYFNIKQLSKKAER